MNKFLSVLGWASVLLILVGSMWLLTIDDITTASELEDSYARNMLLLDRLQELPDREAVIRRQLADLGNEAAAAYLYAGLPHEVQAQIQKHLRQISSSTGVSLSAMRPEGSITGNELIKRVSVRINFTTSFENLVSLLAKIEEQKPLLRVRSASMSVERQSTESEAALIAVGLEVSGFVAVQEGVQ